MTAVELHAVADALHRLGDLAARGRVEVSAGYWLVAATGTDVAEDITAAMTDVVELVDDDNMPVWSGWLLDKCCYIRVVDEPTLAQVAAAALTPDAADLPGGES